MEGAIVKTPRHNSGAGVPVHYQIKRKILDEKFSTVLQRLLIKRMQDSVSSSVLGTTRAFDLLLPVMCRHSTESPLMDPPLFCARKWNPVMF